MKFNLIKTLSVFCLFCINVSNAQVGIGVPAENIHPSAELEVKSNTKGFLPPRMTKAERDAIVAPAAGLLIYQTDGDAKNTTTNTTIPGSTIGNNVIGENNYLYELNAYNGTIPSNVLSIGNSASGGTTNTSLTSGPGLYYFDGTAWKNVVGPQGENGIQGIQGETGAVGPKGDTGAQGIQGDVGLQGIKGDKGETGAVGAQGPQGEPGTSTSAAQLTINSSATSIPSLLSFTTATPGTSVSSLQTDNNLTYIPSTNTLSVDNINATNINGSLTGNASSASTVSVAKTYISSERYLCFTSGAGSNSTLQISDLIVPLKYNPGSGTLTVPNIDLKFGGSIGSITGALVGNASSATQLYLTNSTSSMTRYLSFAASNGSGNTDLLTNSALTFVPSTGNLSARTFTGNVTGNVIGNASSADQIAVTSTSTVGTRYLSFTPSNNLTSSPATFQTNNALTFNPSTGNLAASSFTGNVTATTLKVSNFIQLNPSIVASTTPTSDNIVTAGYISATGSITLPTAAAIASSIGGSIGKGTSVEFTVENSSTGDATLVLGTGMSVQTSPTIAGTNSLVVSQANAIARFRLVFTSATTAMLFRVY